MRKINKIKWAKPAGIILGLVFFIFLSILPAHAFRCGTRLISVGDSKLKVLSTCGDPTQIEIWEEERILRDYYPLRYPDLDNQHDGEAFFVKQHVIIERWTYNRGALKFVRYLKFENGHLVKITTGAHGY